MNKCRDVDHSWGRDGLRISSAPAESGMNHVVNQRMGKRQPMRWSLEEAHISPVELEKHYAGLAKYP
jgi:hypothetical protein